MIVIAMITNTEKKKAVFIQVKNNNLYYKLEPYVAKEISEFEIACEKIQYGRQLHWQFENLFYNQVDGIFNVHYLVLPKQDEPAVHISVQDYRKDVVKELQIERYKVIDQTEIMPEDKGTYPNRIERNFPHRHFVPILR